MYRRHAQRPHCPRCWLAFPNEAWIDAHLRRRDELCEIKEAGSIEGFDKNQEVLIRSRKRTTSSEVDKWKEIYRILFPDDSDDLIPSPCEISPQLRSWKVANCRQFMMCKTQKMAIADLITWHCGISRITGQPIL